MNRPEELATARHEFGYQLMGPVIAEYLMKLDATIRFFDEVRGAKTLFASRAGVRIRRALEVYLKTIGRSLPESAEDFWISRLMVAKGTWRQDRRNAIEIFSGEFKHAKIGKFATALFRHERMPEDLPIRHKSLDASGAELQSFFKQNGPAAQVLDRHLRQQSELFDDYLKDLLGKRKTALLVDSGWAGTAQRLLADAYPDTTWWGAYFGRYGFSHTNRKYWRNMIGLVFEQDEFEFDKPETCTILHRHMIEDLFEPAGFSIERLARDKDGHIIAPEAASVLEDSPDKESDPVFTGVLDYLSRLPNGHAPAVLHRDARKAWRQIARLVALPSLAETEIFSNILRSADFGKTLEVPLLLAPADRHEGDTPEKRIKAALWQPGQAAIEYPKEIAEPLQRKLAGLSRFDFKQPDRKRLIKVKERSRPTVAIITRTLDRPMFLKRALESVAAQTFRDYVQVVVNDGGDIDLAKVTIEESDCAHHKVVLVDNVVNRGMEAASNIAIRAVDSDYIVIHDDDDSWEPDFLEKTIAYLDGPKRRTYGGVITQSTYVSEEITPKGIVIHGQDRYQGWVENVHIMEMAIGNFFPPIAFVFRRDIYDKVGGYNEDYPVLGDWDFNLRFLLESDIGMIHEPLANYHHRDHGDTTLFGNSVIAGRDKHLEYAAVVRNRFARNMLHADHPALAVLVGMGLHFDANRSALRDIQAKTNGAASAVPETVPREADASRGDDYWVAMCRYQKAVTRRDFGVLRHIDGGVAQALKNLFATPLSKQQKKTGNLDWKAIQYLSALDRKGYELEPPPDFDENRYLNTNPDVAKVVKEGDIKSGFDHYYRYGRHEGRQRPSRIVD